MGLKRLLIVAVLFLTSGIVTSIVPAHAQINETGQSGNGITTLPDDASNDTPASTNIIEAIPAIDNPVGLAVDEKWIYVVSRDGASVDIFPKNGTGNVTPTRSIWGTNTALSSAVGVAVDTNWIYVANLGGHNILVFPLTGTGNIPPTRIISSSNPSMFEPSSVVVFENLIYVTNRKTHSVLFFPTDATGDIAPDYSISETSTTLNEPDKIILKINEADSTRFWGRLSSHEENAVGLTHDNNSDETFLDFKISLKYPIAHDGIPDPYFSPRPYFAFTGRFGQYLFTRDSSPVIGKRFNPELFLRGWLNNKPDEEFYYSLYFGHESNGQSINSQNEYYEKRQSLIADHENPNYANDYISRGWDYIGFDLRKKKIKFSELTFNSELFSDFDFTFTHELKLRYFLKWGPLQKDREDYNDWENDPEGKPREYVDGISYNFTTNLEPGEEFKLLGIIPVARQDISIGLTTGYSKIFRYMTINGELGLQFWNLPLSLWISHGYNSDLAHYYKRDTSFGFRLTLRSF